MELCFLSNLTSSEWAAWAQAIAATAAIGAGAYGINWQVRNQHRLQLQREIQKELNTIRDMQDFLAQADHYLGWLAGSALVQDTYITYLCEQDRSLDYRACREVFEETRMRDIPGPTLKLSFKHCAMLFSAITEKAIEARQNWLRMKTLDWPGDREFYAKCRTEFHKSMQPIRDRRAELEAELAALKPGGSSNTRPRTVT